MLNHRLHLGCKIPNTRFSVSREEIEDFLDEFPELENYSLIPVYGKFEGTKEPSYRLEVFGYSYELVASIGRAYKREFLQKAVGYEPIVTTYKELWDWQYT